MDDYEIAYLQTCLEGGDRVGWWNEDTMFEVNSITKREGVMVGNFANGKYVDLYNVERDDIVQIDQIWKEIK